ncbi:FAD-dependent oxidoreductase [Brevibacterium sp. SMBL_HHYL_HB1]|uniref:FAD-dependent oxidoreductase n=1 Tax=Brevibacterium sp. SMBL_HHYL_HB1 TaxID=2777556 RepID=UPI001BA81C9F|nr:FAD-dependent oxidoreductase [Brevibacterium sp. SMBL_HHYL_HB1]QUL80660.1 FAD-dependent oxidoreductase [Brevibacterium sp. SMBL_HHYL_HB1]
MLSAAETPQIDARFAVVGLGAVGSAVLWQLAEQTNGDVIGIEKSHLANDRCAVGGDTRLFRVAYKEGAEFSTLLTESRRLLLELNASSASPVFHPCGALTIGDRDKEYMDTLLKSVQEAGAEHEVLDPTALRRRYPQHGTLDSDIGLFDPAGGLIRTNTAVLAAAERASQHGARIRTGESVTALTPIRAGVRITTTNTEYTVEKAIIATGAWSRDLLPGHFADHMYPGRIILTWCSARNPSEFTPDRFPVFIRDSEGTHMFGTPTVDGDMVKISGVIPDQEVSNPSGLRRELSEEERLQILAAVEKFFPSVYPSIVRADAYPDLFSEDMKPLVGEVSESKGVYLATGFSGRGFKMATGVGAAIARSVLSGQQESALEFACPARFTDVE